MLSRDCNYLLFCKTSSNIVQPGDVEHPPILELDGCDPSSFLDKLGLSESSTRPVLVDKKNRH